LKKLITLNSDEIKMAVPEQENPAIPQSDEQNAASVNELRLPVWSVVSFERSEASGLTYAEAEQKLSELEAQNFSGLCIVTDETAARIAARNQAQL
jgi:hypothetical protein